MENVMIAAEHVTPWFENAGMIGGLMGAGIGILGAVLGTVCGVCAPRGIGKRFVVAMMIGIVTVGVVLLAAGIVAVAVGQPYGVWYALVLSGALLTVITGCLLPVILMVYRQADARRLEAEEFRTV